MTFTFLALLILPVIVYASPDHYAYTYAIALTYGVLVEAVEITRGQHEPF